MKNLINKHNLKIKKIISGFIKNDEAKDVEQEVYIKLLNNNAFDQSFAYIKTVTINTCKDFFKSKQYKQLQNSAREDNIVNFKDHQKDFLEQKEIQKEIISAIKSLKPKHKEIIMLYDIKGLSQEEISKELNCPIGTVKSRLFNARKILQNKLKHLL